MIKGIDIKELGWIEIHFIRDAGNKPNSHFDVKSEEIDKVIDLNIEDGMLIVSCADGTHIFPVEHILRISVLNNKATRRNQDNDR